MAEGDSFLPIEGAIDVAISKVFGGVNARHCDKSLLIEILIPHAPMPTDGFVLYAETNGAESNQASIRQERGRGLRGRIGN